MRPLAERGQKGRSTAVSTDCEHWSFNAQVEVARLTSDETHNHVVGYTADITVTCAEPFTFIGLPMGSLPSEPACNFDGTEARMPIRPISAPDSFGRDLPGFTVREVKQ